MKTQLMSRLILILATLSLLGGCGGMIREKIVFNEPAGTRAIALDVDSFRGDVRVFTDPARENIVVKTIFREKHPRGVKAQLDEVGRIDQTLFEIDAHAELTTDENGLSVLRITTGTEYERPWDQWVNLRIFMPRVDGVRVQTSDGTVDLEGVSGAITVANENGRVNVRTPLALVNPIQITTTEGEINFIAPPDSAGLFSLEAIGARVQFRALDGAARIQQRGESRLAAQLGDGTNPIVLRSIGGNVNVNVTSGSHNTGLLNRWTLWRQY